MQLNQTNRPGTLQGLKHLRACSPHGRQCKVYEPKMQCTWHIVSGYLCSVSHHQVYPAISVQLREVYSNTKYLQVHTYRARGGGLKGSDTKQCLTRSPAIMPVYSASLLVDPNGSGLQPMRNCSNAAAAAAAAAASTRQAGVVSNSACC
jgi:hypothetical protein